MYLNFCCSKGLGVLNIGLDAWDLADDIKALNKGNPKAKLFREAGEKLRDLKNNITQVFDSIKGRCDGNSKKVTFKLEEFLKSKNYEKMAKKYWTPHFSPENLFTKMTQ